MVEFVGSPLYDNWFKRHYPQKSLLICSPYVKKEALERIIALYRLDGRGNDFDFRMLIRGNPDEFTVSKSSDIAIFDSLSAVSGYDAANIRRVKNLHMKAYLIDGHKLLITSGNLTNSGLFVLSGKENFEGGVATDDPGIFTKFILYFNAMWRQGERLDDFYGELMSAYTAYIGNTYSDRRVLQRMRSRSYEFPSRTEFGRVAQSVSVSQNAAGHSVPDATLDDMLHLPSPSPESVSEARGFTLDDIPPAGKLEHIPAVLETVAACPDGISFVALGEQLRRIFSTNPSDSVGTNRKFGEEKGKFAAFLNFVTIDKDERPIRFRISELGRAYLRMNDKDRSSLIKDIFFDKPIIVSIMRESLAEQDFQLLDFLQENCRDATKSTLSRKVGPLRELFSHIQQICTEDELRSALDV